MQAIPGMYPAIQQNLIHVCPYSHNGEAPGAMTIWVCGIWWVVAPLAQKLESHGLQVCQYIYYWHFLNLIFNIFILGVNKRLAVVQGPWFQEQPFQRQDSQNGKLSRMKSDTISGLSWVISCHKLSITVFFNKIFALLQHDVSISNISVYRFTQSKQCTSGCNTTSPCCPLTATTCDANAQFIMSPVSRTGEKVFSQCSLGNICEHWSGWFHHLKYLGVGL